MLLLLAGLGTAAESGASERLAGAAAMDCSAVASATLLHPAPMQAVDARAHWLDRRRVKWPGHDASGRYRLHHSSTAGLLAEKGRQVSGADGSVALQLHAAPLPAALAERFKFVADGVVLALADADARHLPDLLRRQLMLVQEDGQGRVIDATLIQAAGALDDLYAAAGQETGLGVQVNRTASTFKLSAPTAARV
ncbi:MAG: hypothetical protein LH491_06565, partial [Pseudoxanthomonas sp.]|nr:hypothetical protein [Pseudoxanthomonas sp.]